MDDKSDILIRTLKGIPNNAALLSGRLDTVFEDGSKADITKGIYIHHLLVADVGKTSAPFALCPGGHNQKAFVPWLSSHIIESIGAGLIQAGNDQVASPTIYASPNGPMKSAFLTGWDDTFLLEAEIVNYNPENTTIYLALETEFLPEAPDDYLDASTLIFSATGCNSPGYKPPGNNPIYNFTSDLFDMNRDGFLLNMRMYMPTSSVESSTDHLYRWPSSRWWRQHANVLERQLSLRIIPEVRRHARSQEARWHFLADHY